MALWSAWLPDVLPHVPNCPVPLVEHELKRSAQVLLEASRIWRIDLDPAAVPAATVMLSPVMDDPDEQELVRIESVLFDGKPLDLRTPEELDAEAGDNWPSHTGVPTAYTLLSPGIVRLYPVPIDAATTGIEFRVSVKPADAATGVPDEIRTKYKEALTAGAKSRLMLYKDKPWTDYNLAGVHASAFESGVAKATLDAARAFGRGRVPSRPKWC